MATISNVNGKKITKIKYKGEIYDNGGSKNEPITITRNGTYTAPDGVGYSPVSVSVPQTAESGTVKNLLDATKSTRFLFYNYKGTSVDGLISYSDTENVIDMSYMFGNSTNIYACQNLLTPPLLNTSKVKTASYMFSYCENIASIPNYDFKNINTANYMFGFCKNIEEITISMTSLTSCESMFTDCDKLKNINGTINIHNTSTNIKNLCLRCYLLEKLDLSLLPGTSYNSSFVSVCYSLKKLIIRNMDTIPSIKSDAFNYCYHFTGTENLTYNPLGLKDGRIYVPDDKVEELKVATNWSVYADIIVPLSTLVE